MIKNINSTIVTNTLLTACIYELVLSCPDADLENFVPGQFAHIEIKGSNELILKRPISINKIDAKKKTVTLVYQIVGAGTEALKNLLPGDTIKAILPIGRGFSLSSDQKKVFLVGGGVGIAPLLSVVQRWKNKSYEAFLGYRGKDYLYCVKDFEEDCSEVFITSNDGTCGEKGYVTQKLEERISQFNPDIILACGPRPMLKSLKQVVGDIPVQVSLEERMGCGFGACAACVCAINNEDGLNYKKVCIEGPVFDFSEVEI